MLVIASAVLVAASAVGMAEATGEVIGPRDDNIKVYLKFGASATLWLEIQDDKYFETRNCVRLYDQKDQNNQDKWGTFCAFKWEHEHLTKDDKAYDFIGQWYIDKIPGITELYAYIYGWTYKNGDGKFNVYNPVEILADRVTGMTYQDGVSPGGGAAAESSATVTSSATITQTQSSNICIIDKTSKETIECAYGTTTSDKTATAKFRNHFPPPAEAQLVIKSKYLKTGQGWVPFPYTYDITYTGHPPPEVADVTGIAAFSGDATIVASEAITAAKGANICIFNSSTDAEIECAHAVSITNNEVTASFYNNKTDGGVAAKLVIAAETIRDVSDTWNTDASSHQFSYGAPSAGQPGNGTDIRDLFGQQPIQTIQEPNKVTGLGATVSGDIIILSWSAPADGGTSITSYTVEYGDGSSTSTASVSNTTWTHSDPTLGTEYEYKVRAVNLVGDGPWSDATKATAYDVPAQVTGLGATASNGTITLSWSAPADGGSSITSYTVEYSDGSSTSTATASGTTWTHSDPTLGTEYEYKVRANNALGYGPWSDAAKATAYVAPAKVTGLDAIVSGDTVVLSWSAPADGGSLVTSYTVEYSDGSSTSTATASGTTWTHSDPTLGTEYEYKVRAVNSAGDGPWSDAAKATAYDVPAQVTGLGATASNGAITLSWSAPADGGSSITSYTVEYSDGSSTSTATASGTTWTHSDPTLSTEYEYKVRAVNSIGDGPWSDATKATAYDVPAQVTGLGATASNGAITLSWSAPADGGSSITSYTVEYSDGSSTSTATASGTTWTHSDPTLGTEYEYKVRAVNSAGDGPWSDAAKATAYTAPAQVTGLGATASNGAITLSWSAPADGGSSITSYTVEYSDGSSTSTATASGTTWTHSDPTLGTEYEYKVRAVNSAGDGPWSDAAKATAYTAPAQVTGLGATASNGAITLSWSAPADGGSSITSYTVEYSDGSSTSTATASGTTWTHSDPTLGTEYEYKVRAVNSAGDGPWSDAAKATAYTAPAQVTGLGATASNGAITLSWSAPADGGSSITSYTVEYSDGSSTSTATASGTTWTHSDPTLGTEYEYKVRAVNSAGDGPWSDAAKATAYTAPAQVTGLGATASNGAITLSWSAPADGGSSITSYTVEYSDGSSTSTATASGTTWTHANPVNGTSYEYKVRAVNSIGDGPWSDAVTGNVP